MYKNVCSFVGLVLFFCLWIPWAFAYDVPPCIEGVLVYHVHPQVMVVDFVINQKDPRAMDTIQIHPPTNLGLSAKNSGTDSCDREIHTHGAEPNGGHPGLLHTESTDPSRTHYLGEFLVLWSTVNPELVRRIVQESVVVLVSNTSQQLMPIPRQDILDIPLQNDKKIVIVLDIGTPQNQKPAAFSP